MRDCVHLNPVRAKLLRPDQPLQAYRWSSWPEYLKPPRGRWPWLRVDRLLGENRIPQDSAAGRRQLEGALETRRAGDSPADYRLVRRGWCLGDQAFRRELLEQMTGWVGMEPYGTERRETAAQQAEEILRMELLRLGWQEADLSRRAKGDPAKVTLAARLRQETTMTVKWIAGRLKLGTPGHASRLLYRRRKGEM